MKRGHRGETKDYSDVFLAAILIGIVVIVLSLMMAITHPTSRLLGGMVRDDDHHLDSRIGHLGGLNSDPELTMAKFLYASLEPK